MVAGTIEFGSKIGFSNNIGTGNFRILANATVVNPSGEQVRIVSTSTSDSSSGTGIRKIKIVYFDNSWTLKSEVITTNGTTSVDTVATDIFRIESFEAIQTGSNVFGAIGTITAKSIDGTKLFAQIDPDTTLFSRVLHFVAPKKINSITDISIDCLTSGGIIFLLFVTKDNTSSGGGLVFIPDLIFSLANQSQHISLQLPTMTDASSSSQGLEVGIAVKGLAAAQIGSASFHFRDFEVP